MELGEQVGADPRRLGAEGKGVWWVWALGEVPGRLLVSGARLCRCLGTRPARDQLMLPAKSLVPRFFVRLCELAPMPGRYVAS